MTENKKWNGEIIVEPTVVTEHKNLSIQYVDKDGNPVDGPIGYVDANGKPEDREKYWADRISDHLRAGVEYIIKAGQDLQTAKIELGHGKFERMVERLGLGLRMAEMLMKVARHATLSNPNQWFVFPPSWRTLAELATLPATFVEARIKDGTIKPGMTRKDAYALKDAAKGQDHAAAKHKAKVTPLQEMREEINAKDGEIADLQERLADAEAEVDTREAYPGIRILFSMSDVEFIAEIITKQVDDEAKAIAIANAILARFSKQEPVYSNSTSSNEEVAVEDVPVKKRRGRPPGSKNKLRD